MTIRRRHRRPVCWIHPAAINSIQGNHNRPRRRQLRGRPSQRLSVQPGSVGVVPNAAPQPTHQQNSVMSLPPEDQPETGQPKELPANLKKQLVDFTTKEPAGTIVIDTANTYLYLVLGSGKAMRYGIGVGRDYLPGPALSASRA